jgi:hypothetical protein
MHIRIYAKQHTYTVTLRLIRVTIVAEEMQILCYSYGACSFSQCILQQMHLVIQYA